MIATPISFKRPLGLISWISAIKITILCMVALLVVGLMAVVGGLMRMWELLSHPNREYNFIIMLLLKIRGDEKNGCSKETV